MGRLPRHKDKEADRAFETGERAPELFLEDKKQQGDLIAKGCGEQRNRGIGEATTPPPPKFVSTLEPNTVNLEANIGAINPRTQFLGFFALLH